jgi:DNA-binding transcriptional regulator GbsR (MarR family)
MNLLNERLTELVPRRSTVPPGPPDEAAPARAADGGAGLSPEAVADAADRNARNREARNRDARDRDAGDPEAGDSHAGDSHAAERDEKAVGQFIERFAGILFESGVPRMPARVFVALLTADSDRLTAADLGAILKVSPAAVSGAVRYLTQVGLVSGAGEPGSRRLSYSVPSDVWEQLLSMGNQRMTRWTAVLRDGVDVLGRDSPAGERVTESVRYFDFIAAELPRVLARWHEYKAVPSSEDPAVPSGQDPAAPSGQDPAAPSDEDPAAPSGQDPAALPDQPGRQG